MSNYLAPVNPENMPNYLAPVSPENIRINYHVRIAESIEHPTFGTKGSIDKPGFKAYSLDSYLFGQFDQFYRSKQAKYSLLQAHDIDEPIPVTDFMNEKQLKIMKEKAIKDLAFYSKAIEDGIITADEFDNMPSAYRDRAEVLKHLFTKKMLKEDALVGEKLNIASYEDYLGVK